MSKTKKDYIYNLLYQIFTVIFPIMLTPYTSRVLGAEALGIYSYVFTFVSFFIMFAKLGCSNLGQRLIAKNRDNKKKLSESFFSVYYIQFFLTIIMTILFLIFAFLFLKDNIVIALIKSISLFATIFDISWVFTGLEKFKLNVMKNVVIKIITFIFIILFVKNSNDLWIYALILTLSNLLTNLLWINFLKNEIIFVNVKIKNILKNLKSSFILFIPILAKSIYTSMDKIMIGSLTTMNELGIYSQGAKFMSLPYVFTNALSNLMLSKNSNLVAKNQKDQMKKNIEKSLEFIVFLIVPIALGLILISDNLIPVMLGNQFLKSAKVLKILIIATIFVSIGGIFSSQYLIPIEKDNVYSKAVIIGSIVNTLLNFILIPKLNSIGAALGTLITEFIVMIYQVSKSIDDLPLLKYLKIILKYLFKGLIMYFIVNLLNIFEFNNLTMMFFKILFGIIIYLTLNINYIKNIIKERL